MVESAGRGSTLRQAQGLPISSGLTNRPKFVHCRVLGFISVFGIIPKSVIYF